MGVASGGRAPIAPGVAPGALERMDQPVTGPGRRIHVRDTMSGVGHEGGVLAIGDGGAGDGKSRQRNRRAVGFIGVPAPLTGNAVTVSALVQAVGSLTLGRVGSDDEGAGGDLQHRRSRVIRRTGARRYAGERPQAQAKRNACSAKKCRDTASRCGKKRPRHARARALVLQTSSSCTDS